MKLLEALGYTPEHTSAIDAMDKNFAGSQLDYAAASTEDMVNRASNPFTSVVSAAGNVLGRPAYDFVDAAQKYSDKGYQGEFSFTPQGVKDFYGNLKSLGGEFLAQKPHIMMGGALKGGIESLGTQLGEGTYNYIYGPQMRFKQQQIMNRRKQNMQQRIRQAEAAEAAKQKAAADAKQAALQAQVTAQANREAKQRVSRGEARDYGKTETRASSGWESSPFEKGGLVNFYRYGGFIG